MGFLDKAKRLAAQAKEVAEQAKDLAEGAIGDARARASAEAPPAPPPADDRMGTPYTEGMLGRPGWREQGLVDPAAVLPIADRDRAGVPHSTKSEIVDEPFGMGRRWTAGGRSVGLFYQLYPEQWAWEPTGGKSEMPAIEGATQATLSDGRALVFLSTAGRRVVVETRQVDDASWSDLVHAAAHQLAEPN